MKKKKRGAPSGNRNAWKHGFYSSAFKEGERRLLSQVHMTDLGAEIDLIRIANYRFLQALNAAGAPLDVDTQLAAVRAVNLSAQSITSLIRAQALTSAVGDTQTLAKLLNNVESEDDPPGPPALQASAPD